MKHVTNAEPLITLAPAEYAELRQRAARAALHAALAFDVYSNKAEEWAMGSDTIVAGYQAKANVARADAAYWRKISEGNIAGQPDIAPGARKEGE